MKNRIMTGSLFLLTAIVLSVGPRTFMKVCTPRETVMKCWWSIQAELGMAILLALVALGLFIFKSESTRLGISYMAGAIGFAIILIPSVLVGGCMKATMPCRVVTFPGIYVTGVIVLILAIANCIYLCKKRN